MPQHHDPYTGSEWDVQQSRTDPWACQSMHPNYWSNHGHETYTDSPDYLQMVALGNDTHVTHHSLLTSEQFCGEALCLSEAARLQTDLSCAYGGIAPATVSYPSETSIGN